MPIIPFHCLDLLQPSNIALLPREGGAEEGLDEISGQLRADYLRPQTEHVHVIVLDALVGGVGIVADCRADAGKLAGRDRGAHARPADEDAALGLAREDRVAELLGLVRVVDHRLGAVGTDVHHLVPVGGEVLEDTLAQLDAAVVEADYDLHEGSRYTASREAVTLVRMTDVRPSSEARSWRTRSRSLTPRWSKPTTTFTRVHVTPPPERPLRL